MGTSEELALLMMPLMLVPLAIVIRIELNKLGKRITLLENQVKIQDEINRHIAKKK